MGGDKVKFAFSKGPSGRCVEGRLKGDPSGPGRHRGNLSEPRRRVGEGGWLSVEVKGLGLVSVSEHDP